MSFTDIHRVPLHDLSISLSSCLLLSDIICYKGFAITGDMYITDHMWWHSADEFKVLLFIIMTQNHSRSRILRPELNFLHEHTSHIPWFSKNDSYLHSHTSFVTRYTHFLYFLGLQHSASELLIQELLLWTAWLWFISPVKPVFWMHSNVILCNWWQ